jgi:hypothetical protein
MATVANNIEQIDAILPQIKLEVPKGLLNDVQGVWQKILNNKLYLGILVVVVILLCIGLFLYKNYYNKFSFINIPFFNKKEIAKGTSNLLNLAEEYHIIDPAGEKILVTPYLIEILKQHCNQQVEHIENVKQETRPKLNHPGTVIDIPTQPDPPSDIPVTEDNTQALTMAEIEELKRQLVEMENKVNDE